MVCWQLIKSLSVKSFQQQQCWRRNFHVTKAVTENLKVGIVGMGHVGNAVCHNLLRKGYTVTAITDIKEDNCKGYPNAIAIKKSAREVAEMSDIVVSGKRARVWIILARASADF